MIDLVLDMKKHDPKEQELIPSAGNPLSLGQR